MVITTISNLFNKLPINLFKAKLTFVGFAFSVLIFTFLPNDLQMSNFFRIFASLKTYKVQQNN